MYKYILLIHILGATIWTGGHIVLACIVLPGAFKERAPAKLREFESAYEKFGIPALIVQVLTGFWLAHHVMPEIGNWFSLDNAISNLILLKISLLVLTIIVAVDARLRIIPGLNENSLMPLAWHIIPVTIISVLFVVAGAGFRTGGYF
jgi:uncharacterized membrane protein